MYQDEDTFSLPRQIFADGDLFLMKIHGNLPAGIPLADGDWAVVREQATADDGDTVAVMIDGDAAVRIFQDWDDGEATVIGKVVSVIRRV